MKVIELIKLYSIRSVCRHQFMVWWQLFEPEALLTHRYCCTFFSLKPNLQQIWLLHVHLSSVTSQPNSHIVRGMEVEFDTHYLHHELCV